MMTYKGHRLIREDPPADGGGSTLENLEELATTPNEWGRIATYDKMNTARQIMYDLRSRKRPSPTVAGMRWLHTSGPVDGQIGKWGIWSKLVPEGEEDSTPE